MLGLMMGGDFSLTIRNQDAAGALSRYRRVTHEVVHSIKSRHLSTIVLDFILRGNNDIVSRGELLTFVGSQAMQDALKSHPTLSQLRLGVADDLDPAHDQVEAWWEQAFADALAPVSQRQRSSSQIYGIYGDDGIDYEVESLSLSPERRGSVDSE
ncbi:hypothetical protein FKP32DRAFT_1451325 [Trametes sanguinea]|nr:hypothetical protein FKP32DRAFT_1451325 [Trametes sanguinea]